MTTITQDINDLAGVDDNTSWTFYTEQIRLSSTGTTIVSTKKIRKYPVAGVLTVQLDPGPAVVIAPDGKKYPFTVPVSASDLWTLIAGAIGMPPGTTQQAIAAAVTDYLNAHQIDEYHEYVNLAAFPATGATDRLYLAQDTGKIYRWTGSAYQQIADKAAVGLGNVDNTSDANKPVSTAQQAALDLKAPLASPAFTGTPTGITKTHVGLGNVDNTSDVNKPVSTAQAAALLGLVQAAKNPDLLVTGAITVDGSDLMTSAAVAWPDGSPGTLTITSRDSTSAVLGYNITYGSPVTKTYTQPTITRNANGAATNVPAIVVT